MRRGWGVLVAVFGLLPGCVLDVPPAEGAARGDEPRVERVEALLWASPYSELVIEVDYLRGVAPSEEALRNLVAVAEAQTAKRKVTLLSPEELPAGAATRAGETWTLAEAYAVHHNAFDLDEPWALGAGTQAYLHVIYLDSVLVYEYRGATTRAVGVQSGNVLFLFLDDSLFTVGSIRGPGGPRDLPGSTEGEIGILLHEFGHALGLVDNGAPMVRPHNDPDDPAHSSNPDSIMSRGWDLRDELKTRYTRGEAPSLRFDDDDLADLAAVRALEPLPSTR